MSVGSCGAGVCELAGVRGVCLWCAARRGGRYWLGWPCQVLAHAVARGEDQPVSTPACRPVLQHSSWQGCEPLNSPMWSEVPASEHLAEHPCCTAYRIYELTLSVSICAVPLLDEHLHCDPPHSAAHPLQARRVLEREPSLLFRHTVRLSYDGPFLTSSVSTSRL